MKLPKSALRSLTLAVAGLGVAGCDINLSNPSTEPSAPTKAEPPKTQESTKPTTPNSCTPNDEPIGDLIVPNSKPTKEPRFCPACGRG
jgi:hypothetical protein